MSQIFDVVIALLIVAATTFIISYILGFLGMVLPDVVVSIIVFAVAVQLVLFVVHRKD